MLQSVGRPEIERPFPLFNGGRNHPNAEFSFALRISQPASDRI
jgi:hypothetical protein